MSYIFYLWSALAVLLSPILCFMKTRKYVLFSFVLMTVISPIVFGYMYQNGLLISGKLWSVLDIQFLCLMLIALPLIRGEIRLRRSGLDSAVLIMSLLIVLSFGIGVYRLRMLGGALNISRQFMGVFVYFVMLKVFTDPENVKQFYRWVMYFALFVVLVHVSVAFKLFFPPMIAATFDKMETALVNRALIRSSSYLFEPFYVVSISVAICYIFYGKSHKVLAYIVLVGSLFATLLTQARGMYGATFLVVVGVMGFVKRKVVVMMVAIVCLLGVFVALKVASSTGVDVFYRFRGYKLEHEGYFDTVRGAEFGSLLREIKRAPLGLLTGQGLGMRHQGSLATDTRAHFHNDYLGALFSLGIVGFGCYCFIIFSSIFRGRHYCRDDDLALLIMPVRLVFFALAAYAFLNQTFWLYKGTSLLMAMLAISSNSHHYSVLKAQSDYLMGDLEHDLDYVESVEGMN